MLFGTLDEFTCSIRDKKGGGKFLSYSLKILKMLLEIKQNSSNAVIKLAGGEGVNKFMAEKFITLIINNLD